MGQRRWVVRRAFAEGRIASILHLRDASTTLRRQVRAREEKARQPSVTEQRHVAKRHVLRRQLRDAASESREPDVVYLAVSISALNRLTFRRSEKSHWL